MNTLYGRLVRENPEVAAGLLEWCMGNPERGSHTRDLARLADDANRRAIRYEQAHDAIGAEMRLVTELLVGVLMATPIVCLIPDIDVAIASHERERVLEALGAFGLSLVTSQIIANALLESTT